MRFLVLIIVCMLLMPPAMADGRLDALERQLLGRPQTGLPLETRIGRLESFMGQPAPSALSQAARLERLYAMHRQLSVADSREAARKAYNRGVDMAAAGDYPAAIEAYREALRQDPLLLEAYNNLAHLLQEMEQYDEAIRVYERALAQWPEEPLLHRNLGVVCEKTGQIEKALEAFQKYLKLSPQDDPPIRAMVDSIREHHTLLEENGDYAAAATDATQKQRLIWPLDRNPIRVYAQIDSQDAVLLTPLLQSCLREWESASQGRLKLVEVGSPAISDIHVSFQPRPYRHAWQDVAHARYDGSIGPDGKPVIERVHITVNIGTPNDPTPLARRMDRIRPLILHELGHALGIWGHSPHSRDIMYMRPLVTTLSDRDIRTLHKLYQNTP